MVFIVTEFAAEEAVCQHESNALTKKVTFLLTMLERSCNVGHDKPSTEERKQVLAALVEGNSLRSVTRMTGVHRTTVLKLLCDLGRACSDYQDKTFRNLQSKRIQCDEIWSFVYAKDKNCTRELKAKGAGSAWTWVALDADSKLVPCWFIGPRHAGCAYHFLADLKDRLANRVQLTTDGHKAYLDATERAFGTEIDYAMLENALQPRNLHGRS